MKCAQCGKPRIFSSDFGDYDDAIEWSCTCGHNEIVERLEHDAQKLQKAAMIEGLNSPKGKLYWSHMLLLQAIVRVNILKTHSQTLLDIANQKVHEAEAIV